MGSREGFEDYVNKLHGQAKDDAYIMSALDQAFVKKQKEK
jgi:hypothetical protein